MKLDDIRTPALVLDRARLDRNLAAMSARMRALGVDLRPHLKTAKSVEVARRATAGHSGAIAVSTIREAAAFARAGFTDMIYAVGIAPAKLADVAAIQATGAHLAVVTDSVAVARAIAAHPAGATAPFRVLIEIDSGAGRAGLAPDDPALSAIAEILASAPGVELRGVLTHAGHAYHCRTTAEIEAVAEAERQAAVAAAQRLRDAGHDCPVVSVGSTPTAVFARRLEGVTEARPGVYMFYDLFQLGLGCCAVDDLALSVLASVIGHRPREGRLLIDAGALALSQDRSTAAQAEDQGYGRLAGLVDGRPLDALKVVAVNQEHGIVAAQNGPVPFDALPIGARVRVLPNHACMTAAAHDRYHVVAGDDSIVAIWPRCNGW